MTVSATPATPAGLPALLRPLTAFYLDLHRHPELSGGERRTADRFAGWLESAGYATTRGIGGHGVAGVLRRGAGPTVMLRAELDALPVRETTGLPYASEGPAAHACGHDLHLAAAAGAASLLAGPGAPDWRGTLVVVGQPAEETLEGARAMLADGLYERTGRPDVVLAQHCAPLPAGMVAHGYGPMTAGSVTFRVVVHGRGGHAGAPQLTVDPVVAAAHVVTRLQTVVSREAAPSELVAVTVGSFRAGERANVVPDRAELGITVRAAGEAALARAAEAVERIVRAECAASGCPREPEIVRESSSPVTHPDPATTATVREAHTARLGAERVAMWPPSLATEDFGLFGDAGRSVHGAEGVRLAYWMLGAIGPAAWAAAPGEGAAAKLAALPANHAPDFAPDVRTALPAGVTALAEAALACLDRRR
ncbi:amidohydrolase [Streptomyces sp. NBC_00249]|uniref:amidohydrolase n=1 Tax=Streptomyces sp. NBC_00249 TaxID=2975690 RepID=UPI0022562F5D|nr:amidohydrolase [Streptomyces sp. NBC_00249]MCX5192582.1 amidohydrolase [Streptomyces sp. NBC_00249]